MRNSLHIITLLLLSIAASGSSCTEQSRSPRLAAAINTLDSVLANRDKIIGQRASNAATLSAECARCPNTDNMLTAARAFDGIDNDSAVIYTYSAMCRAAEDGDSANARSIAISFAHRLAKSALPQQASAILYRISTDSLDSKDKIRYYGVKSAMLIDAANTQTLNPLREKYTAAAITTLDTLLSLVDQDSDYSHIITAQLQYLRGNIDLATGELNEVFDNISPHDPIYPKASSLMASFYKGIPDKKDEYLYYLTLASIADARSANGEAAALVELGSEIYRHGDIDRAYNYLSASGDYAVQSNTRRLYSRIVPSMSMFLDTMRTREARHAAWTEAMIIVLVCVLMICGILLWRIARKNTRQRMQNIMLNESITLRDRYIKQLLDLCSVYVDGMEEFNRLVSRKLKVNQTQDLYKMIESGKLLQDQTVKFFDVFDSAIANIYPDFIDELNNLLLPDKQLTALPGGKLTPELRIVAFMRLGVSDSTRLSKFLGLSINTIYTYRNRMKSRAINRDTFEADILKIGQNT